MSVLPSFKLTYNYAVFFLRNNLRKQINLIQYKGRSKHALPFNTKLKNNNNIKRIDIENSPLDGSVESGQSPIALYVVCKVIMGFEQKRSK